MEATLMKALGVISTAALFLFLGATVPAFAQEEHHQESAKPAQHEEQAKPAAKQQQAKPQRQEQHAKPAKQEQARPEKQQQQAKPQQEQQAKGQEQNQQKQSQQQAKNQEQSQQKHSQQQAKSQEQNQQKQSQQQAKNQQQQHENQHQQQVKTQQNEEKNQEQHQQQQANGHAEQSRGEYARNGQKDRYGHEYNESRFGPNHYARFEQNGGRYYHGRREYSYGGYWFYAGAYPAWFYQQDVYFILGADGLWYAVAYNDPSLTFQVNIG
jgi:hypothetical protein